jgi:hypothetical protein
MENLVNVLIYTENTQARMGIFQLLGRLRQEDCFSPEGHGQPGQHSKQPYQKERKQGKGERGREETRGHKW